MADDQQHKLNHLQGEKSYKPELETKHDKPLEPFYFVQAADSQFGLIDRYILKLPEPNWDKEIALNEAFVAACNKLEPKPKFLVVCGDLVDAAPATEQRPAQVRDFRRIFSKLDSDIPLVCVCGNHDIGDVPTLEAIEEYKQQFGTEDYFYFVVEQVLFIVINSQVYENREHVQEYAAKHDQWLESMLDKCKLYKHAIILEHIPWFLEEPNEEDQYFNVNRDIRLEWLRKFSQAGVRKIFCGHYHRNGGGWFDDKLELVVTSAIGAQLGDDKSGARLVKVTEQNIEHKYYSTEELPTKVEL